MPLTWAKAASICAARLRSMWGPPVYRHHACEAVQKLHSIPAAKFGSHGAPGQTVAIIDEGEASFLHYAQMPTGALKLLGTIDARQIQGVGKQRAPEFVPNRATLGVKPRRRGCTSEEWNNHVAKCTAFAYWSEQTIQPTGSATCPSLGHANMSAHGSSIVSVRFSSQLYVSETGAKPSAVQMQRYLAGLVRSLDAVLRLREELHITTVQISAVDGLFNGTTAWRVAAPDLLARFTELAGELAAANVWVSAPTGNAHDESSVSRIGWPARNRHVLAIGCANISGAPDADYTADLGGVMRKLFVRPRREPNAPNQLLIMAPQPFTSQCNAIACATAMVARELLAKRCDLALAAVPVALLQHAMRASARPAHDSKTGAAKLLVVDDTALYLHVNTFDCTTITNLVAVRQSQWP